MKASIVDTPTTGIGAGNGPGAPTGPGRVADPRSGHSRTTVVLFGGATLGLLVSIVAASLFGTADMGPLDVISTMLRHLGLGAIAPAEPLPRLLDALIWESRVPRVLLAAAVGAALSVSGAVLQSVTRNPLADPYLLGVSSGASTGAVAVLLLGIGGGSLSLSTGAFIGAMGSFGVLMALLGGGRVSNPARVVLTGVLVSQFFAAVTSVILMVNGDANSTRGFTYWLLGSLGGARWEPLVITGAIIVIGVIAIQFFASALDAFTFGWDSASALGVNVTATRLVDGSHRGDHRRSRRRVRRHRVYRLARSARRTCHVWSHTPFAPASVSTRRSDLPDLGRHVRSHCVLAE
jgi:iron complex transport system permease protein